MGASSGPKYNNNGLVFILDPANRHTGYSGTGTSVTALNKRNPTTVSGTLSNSNMFNKGNGGVFLMDTTNQYRINLGNSGKVQTACSIFAWIYLDDLTNHSVIVKGIGGTSAECWGLSVEGGSPVARIAKASTDTFDEATANTRIPTREWHHIGFTWSTSANQIEMFTDGVADGTTPTSVSDIESTGADVRVGRNGGLSDYMDGVVGLIHVYDNALPDSEVKNIYNGTKGRYIVPS